MYAAQADTWLLCLPAWQQHSALRVLSVPLLPSAVPAAVVAMCNNACTDAGSDQHMRATVRHTFSEYGSALKTSGAMYMRLPVRPVSLKADSSSFTNDRSWGSDSPRLRWPQGCTEKEYVDGNCQHPW
jgi:hypothetical protein